MAAPFDLANTLPPWGPLLDMRPKRFVALGQEYVLNPAATDAGRRGPSTALLPAKREALGAEPPAPFNAASIRKALDAIAVARALRFAGLNTPDRKQLGAAQYVRTPARPRFPT